MEANHVLPAHQNGLKPVTLPANVMAIAQRSREMTQNHIWRSEANPNQYHVGYAAQLIPEHVTIVVVERTSSGIATCASKLIQTSEAQWICREMLESPHQLASVCDAMRLIENHGVVLTNTVIRNFHELEGAIFYDRHLLLKEYVAFMELIENELGELFGLNLEHIEINSAQPFVILACY